MLNPESAFDYHTLHSALENDILKLRHLLWKQEAFRESRRLEKIIGKVGEWGSESDVQLQTQTIRNQLMQDTLQIEQSI